MKFKDLKTGDWFHCAYDDEICMKINYIDKFYNTVSLEGGYYCESWDNEEVIKVDKKILDTLKKQ